MVHWCCTKHSCKGTKNGIAHQHFLSHADPPRRELFFSFLLFLLHKTAGSAWMVDMNFLGRLTPGIYFVGIVYNDRTSSNLSEGVYLTESLRSFICRWREILPAQRRSRRWWRDCLNCWNMSCCTPHWYTVAYIGAGFYLIKFGVGLARRSSSAILCVQRTIMGLHGRKLGLYKIDFFWALQTSNLKSKRYSMSKFSKSIWIIPYFPPPFQPLSVKPLFQPSHVCGRPF